MSFLSSSRQPEDYYHVTITDTFVSVVHPQGINEKIAWIDIVEILLINTNEGPILPDVWLTLKGEESGCAIPQGAAGYDEVYSIVSKYHGFNFENVIKSMQCTDNAEFQLWRKES